MVTLRNETQIRTYTACAPWRLIYGTAKQVGRSMSTVISINQARTFGPEFRRLANALSVLCPRVSQEKRLLDAMLLAVPR